MTAELSSIIDFIRYGASAFGRAGLTFGHSFDNALDESTQLVLHALHLPHDIGPAYGQARLTAEEKAAMATAKAAKAAKKGTNDAPRSRGGRPKGRKTQPKDQVTLTAELQRISATLTALLARMAGWVTVKYLVLDGHFGNNKTLCMVRQHHLHLISKLRADSALHQPYTGAHPRGKYGARLDYHALPADWLIQQTTTRQREGTIQTHWYHGTAVHAQFAHPLNVVILEKINLRTQARAHVILFSSDLTLAAPTLATACASCTSSSMLPSKP